MSEYLEYIVYALQYITENKCNLKLDKNRINEAI
jgi:hypothetical protein